MPNPTDSDVVAAKAASFDRLQAAFTALERKWADLARAAQAGRPSAEELIGRDLTGHINELKTEANITQDRLISQLQQRNLHRASANLVDALGDCGECKCYSSAAEWVKGALAAEPAIGAYIELLGLLREAHFRAGKSDQAIEVRTPLDQAFRLLGVAP